MNPFHKKNMAPKHPFATVRIAEILVEGLPSRDDAAFLQYRLLLHESVLRCHVEFSSGRAVIAYNPLKASVTGLLGHVAENGFPAKLQNDTGRAFGELARNENATALSVRIQKQ